MPQDRAAMPDRPAFRLRLATPEDAPALAALIARSARGLSVGDYDSVQVEAALAGAFGVDSQLIRDGTCFVAEQDGVPVGCGGWSRRRTLFGGDTGPNRDAGLLDPAHDAARIRAFFVDPAHARRGIGRALLERCEAEAQAAGFRAFQLMATLPGQRLYAALGYVGDTPVDHPLRPGVTIRFVPMTRAVASADAGARSARSPT
jgi:GNAT superfamily N-acetyltransferase